ncbi:MAG: hypothetical protein OXF83_03530 [Anaerolineaceae bacterium]|nr:hypothetical protein [Anaerolineaceae bacterium]MCY4106359.1 hypothetical protein [Chloroflexota bacterium]
MNVAIVVSGRGAQEFTCFITERVPCLDLVSKSQVFPRWSYREVGDE